MKKILIIYLVVLIFFMIIPLTCYAEDLGLGDLEQYRATAADSTELTSRAEHILGIIQVVGTVISVVMLVIIGIKYMLGSIEERAEYKENLKPYLIGAFLIFTGTTVPQLIYRFMQNF